MKRRLFLAAGIGSAAILSGSARPTQAAEKAVESRFQIWQCAKCGSMVDVVAAGKSATLTHCGAPMKLLEEKTAPPATEKHVPIISKIDGGYKVVVGSSPHPMTEAHLIEWIELIADGRSYRQFLKPGDKPEAVFKVEAESVCAREHCNKHGLWKNA